MCVWISRAWSRGQGSRFADGRLDGEKEKGLEEVEAAVEEGGGGIEGRVE